jgi:hypothetical protein
LRVENNVREIDFEETSAKEHKAGEIRQNTGNIYVSNYYTINGIKW